MAAVDSSWVNSWTTVQTFIGGVALQGAGIQSSIANDVTTTGPWVNLGNWSWFGSIDLSGGALHIPGTMDIPGGPNYAPLSVSGSWPSVGKSTDPPASTEMGKVNRTNQSAVIASTKLTDTTSSGYYVVSYTIETTTADVTAGTIQFQIGYTDDVGATTQAGAALILTATGRDRGSFQVYLASGNITYQTNLTGIIGSSRYALRGRVAFLG